jgi:hypothetical protein
VPVPQPAPVVTPLPIEPTKPATPKAKPVVPAVPPPVPTDEQTKPPAAVAGALDILSRPPGARVILDGHPLAILTPARAQRVNAGMHRVTVEKKGFQSRELSVLVDGTEHRTLDVELRRASAHNVHAPHPQGFLTVKTVPWAKVYDGARLVGTTPFASVPIGEGAHVLTFVNPDLPPVKRTVTVRDSEETKISLELKP